MKAVLDFLLYNSGEAILRQTRVARSQFCFFVKDLIIFWDIKNRYIIYNTCDLLKYDLKKYFLFKYYIIFNQILFGWVFCN